MIKFVYQNTPRGTGDAVLKCQKFIKSKYFLMLLPDDLIIKNNCSPRHIPSLILPIRDIPYTINGKKVEIAVKNIINGINPKNKSALSNPKSLDLFKNIKELKNN